MKAIRKGPAAYPRFFDLREQGTVLRGWGWFYLEVCRRGGARLWVGSCERCVVKSWFQCSKGSLRFALVSREESVGRKSHRFQVTGVML